MVAVPRKGAPAMRRAVLSRNAILAAAVLGVASLASVAATGALAAPTAPGPGHRPAAAAVSWQAPTRLGIGGQASADTGTDITTLGSTGWKVLSSASTTATGAQISTPGLNTSNWLSVTNDDAGAPGTEIEALAQNGLCPSDTALQPVNQSTSSPNSVFFSNNMQLCYGYMKKIGPASVSLFDVPWWWRTDFTPNLASGQTATLIVNGVIGSANVWVNGTQVATSTTVTGAYTRFTFNI